MLSAHLAKHNMDESGETWLSDGLKYLKDDACSFCGQSTEGIALIDAYKTHFSDAYNELKASINGKSSKIQIGFSDRVISEITAEIEKNVSKCEFWQEYCEIELPKINEKLDIEKVLQAYREITLNLLKKKVQSPLEEIKTDNTYSDALSNLLELGTIIDAYNASIIASNKNISLKKEEVEGALLETVENEFILLIATKKRHEKEVVEACSEYSDLITEKNILDHEKEEKKTALKNHSNNVVRDYENIINEYLRKINAGFRIGKTSHTFAGGVASSSYHIIINDRPIKLGDERTPLSEPSFKNTLSSGDRSTLALAFFLAQIEQDDEKSNKIIIFDDPFTSLDRFRQSQTVYQIKKCGERCKQVIVLSHDPNFLGLLWERLSPGQQKTLQLTRVQEKNTMITEWDIEEALKWTYHKDIDALLEYLSDGSGDEGEIIKKLRIVLEGYCKLAYPRHFGNNDALGSIVEKIKEIGGGHILWELHEELEEINEYCRRYHHDDGQPRDGVLIDSGELQDYVEKSLKIAGHC